MAWEIIGKVEAGKKKGLMWENREKDRVLYAVTAFPVSGAEPSTPSFGVKTKKLAKDIFENSGQPAAAS